MSIRFYFVRHGESTVNLNGYFYEDENAELTELGRAQASQVGLDLKDLDVEFTAIFTSPYRRARDTCQIALERAKMHGVFKSVDERLGERKYGALIGLALRDGKIDDLYNYDLDCSKQYGVESLVEMKKRAESFINEMIRNYQEGDILIFSHADFGMVFRAAVEGRPESGDLFDIGMLDNGEMIKIEKFIT